MTAAAETLFTRHGETVAAMSARHTAKGAPYVIKAVDCGRCGGQPGASHPSWAAHNQGRCFKCNGTGRVAKTFKLYTAEKLAKLNARRDLIAAKKAAAFEAKRAALAAEIEARRVQFFADNESIIDLMKAYAPRSEFIADVLDKARARCIITEGQELAVRAAVAKINAADEARAASKHVGTIGQRIECAVTVTRINHYERPNFGRGFGTETVWIVSMSDEAGNVIVSKSPNFYAEVGEAFTIRATVKEHGDYKGLKQTTVQRLKRK